METTPADGDQSQVCLSRGWGLAKRTTGVWVGWVPCNVYSLAVDRATCENTAFGGTWAHGPVVHYIIKVCQVQKAEGKETCVQWLCLLKSGL